MFAWGQRAKPPSVATAGREDGIFSIRVLLFELNEMSRFQS